jgi:hypothetical protein
MFGSKTRKRLMVLESLHEVALKRIIDLETDLAATHKSILEMVDLYIHAQAQTEEDYKGLLGLIVEVATAVGMTAKPAGTGTATPDKDSSGGYLN